MLKFLLLFFSFNFSLFGSDKNILYSDEFCYLKLANTNIYTNFENNTNLSSAIFFSINKKTKNIEISINSSVPYLKHFPISISFADFKFETFPAAENDNYAFFKFYENNLTFINELIRSRPNLIYVFSRHNANYYSVSKFNINDSFFKSLEKLHLNCV